MSHPESALADPAQVVPRSLWSRLQQVAETLDNISGDLASALPAGAPHILAEHRGTFYQAMDALGGGILDFLAEHPSPDEIETVRDQIAAPIWAWSATSPIFSRLVRSSTRGPRDFEIPALVVGNRRVGADISAMVFNDYYLHSIAAQALRNRFAMLTRHLLQDVAQRSQAGVNPVQVLNLKCDSGVELVRLADEPGFAAAQITCLDEDPTALRTARAELDKRLLIRGRFLRVNALKYARSPLWRSQHYDVCYASVLCDYLTSGQIVALIRDCYGLLASGGVLILGYPTSGVPANERVIGRLGAGPGGSLPGRTGFPSVVCRYALRGRGSAIRARTFGR